MQRLLQVSFDKGLDADAAAGSGKAEARGNVLFTDGVQGKAIVVDAGVSVTYPLPGNLDPASGTLCFWAKPIGWTKDADQYHYFVTFVGDDDWILLQTVGSDLVFLGGKRKSYNQTTTAIDDWIDGKWRYVVVTWDNGKNRIYLDGKPATVLSEWPTVPTNLGTVIRVGGQLHSRSTGGTAIDELQIFSASASEEQVKALYQAAIQSSPELRAEDDFMNQQQKREPNNISKAAFGAIVLPSSQSTSMALAVENVIDGDFNTRWQSATGIFPNWIEIRWPQPVILNKLVINEHPLHKTAQYRIDAYRNGKWTPVVPAKANTRKPGEQMIETFAPVETTKLRYFMLKPEGDPKTASSSVLELQACSSTEMKDLSWIRESSWKSNWIWYPEGLVSDVVRFFRKHFSVDDLSAIKEAVFQIAADDTYEAYLNGKLIGIGSIPTTLYDIKPLLVSGDNVLAVKCHEFGGFEGVIAELALIHARGSVSRIVTDKTWQASNRDEPNWFAPAHDDKEWKWCKEEGIPPNCEDHASQEYFNKGIKEQFRLIALHTSPAEIKPGSTVEFRFEMETPAPIQNEYGFVLRVGEARNLLHCDYMVATTKFAPPVPTTQWTPKAKQTFSARLFIPEWAPNGEIPIFLTAAGREIEGQIVDTQEGIVGNLKIKKFATDPKLWPAEPPKVEVRREKGHPTLFVNGEVVPPYIMTENSFPSYQAFGEHAKSGTHLWRIHVSKGVFSRFMTGNRDEENQEFFRTIDGHIQSLLKVDPKAYILVGTTLTVNQEWSDNNPDDATLLADGRRVQHSFSSRKWIDKTRGDVTALVKHLMSQPYSGHVIGVNFGIGVGPETYYWGFSANPYDTIRDKVVVGDYSPEHIRAFREWLKERYGNEVKALRAAWKNDKVDFQSAAPDINLLRKEDLMVFRDPTQTRMPMDYWEFHSDVMARRVIDIARSVKEASGGKYITGFWGLYSNGENAMISSPGQLHHVAYCGLQRVLESPFVDYIAMLQSYVYVRWGTPMVPINLTESIRQHGKMCLVEYDMRTFFTPIHFTERTFSQQETLSVIRRDVAAAAIRGDGLWWVGFPDGTQGRISVPWFAEDSILDTLKEGKQVYDAVYRCDLNSVSEVAVFMNSADVYTLDVMMAHNLLASAQFNTSAKELTKLGAPFDQYLLDDVALAGMDRYKVYFFLNAFNVTEKQKENIRKLLAKPGKTAVWLYAPGFSDGAGLSTKNIEELTGFKVAFEKRKGVPEVEINPAHSFTAGVEQGHRLQPVRYQHNPGVFEIGPIFDITDPAADVLGRYTDNGKVACAYKKVGDGNFIYMAIPYMDSTLARSICRASGVHLYADNDVYLDATRHFLTITATESGYRSKIKLPTRGVVYDVFERRVVDKDTDSFQTEVPPLTTALYYIGLEGEMKRFVNNLDAK